MNNFDWLVQEFFTKSAAEDKKEKDDEKKESPKHEAMEKKVEAQEKKEDKKEKKASRLELYLSKSSSVSVHETAEALDGLADVIVAHPGKAALVAGIGLPVLYGLGQGMNIGLGALSHHIGKDMHKDNFAVKHPYLTDLAGIPANAILPGAALATETAARAGATSYADELASHKPHGGEGVLARYSMKNPHMGPFLSMFVPGTHSVNSTLAAKTIADRAIKEKSFTYRHPYMSAYGHGLIPGSGTAYAQAAARIQDYKDSL